MQIYYYSDEKSRKGCNEAGRDYTPAYLPLMLKTLGFTAHRFTPGDPDIPGAGDALLIGAETPDAKGMDALSSALGRGCTLIGFGTTAPGVFPATRPLSISRGDYTVTGYFSLDKTTPLPVIGAVGAITDGDATVLGTFSDGEGNTGAAFAHTGERVYYFSFDLPGTLWHAADGAPTYEPVQQLVPFGRVPDGYVIPPDYDCDIPYAEEYLSCLDGILSGLGFARVSELPVIDGALCDMALYFAGDDDAGSAENDMEAARAMKSRGLPYHINLMPADAEGRFVISKEQFDTLHEWGCETDLHFDFTRFEYSERGSQLQRDMYVRAFCEEPFSPVNHCLIQVGSAADRYRMQVKCGCKSDNNRFEAKPDPSDINAFNLSGFACGTSYPRFVLDDAAHGNAQLPFCEIYNSYYEPRIYTGSREEYEKIEKYIDRGAERGSTLQLFTHPHYISGKIGFDPAPALRAIDHALSYIKERKYSVWFTAPQKLTRWWFDRAECSVKDAGKEGFVFDNPTKRSVSVILPDGVGRVTVNGAEED
ncbi:MAG: hypothetical protein J5879_00805, partial [Clostridia bacterium]|nr:hypothetical protein [Clostridia bacterium]